MVVITWCMMLLVDGCDLCVGLLFYVTLYLVKWLLDVIGVLVGCYACWFGVLLLRVT